MLIIQVSCDYLRPRDRCFTKEFRFTRHGWSSGTTKSDHQCKIVLISINLGSNTSVLRLHRCAKTTPNNILVFENNEQIITFLDANALHELYIHTYFYSSIK